MPLSWTASLAKTCLVIYSLTVFLTATASPTKTTLLSLSSTQNNSSSSNDISEQCTKAQTWISRGIDRKDCTAVLDYIHNAEVLQRKAHRFEFTSPASATTKTEFPKIATPRKYAFRTCVVTVAMLDQFRPRELPGSDFRERYEETDVTTFDEVWDAALEVEIWCGRAGKAGWIALGKFIIMIFVARFS